ncbi:MAG: bifunctional phosphopantothenoylcysteine decarboxylase/phosphopantothenate--cysteine ligase CoaBC [Saprospiraceae bacterium]|nr:MAG: bifunctional phosphopantothenoylcysteine decarboxylase/phosphopantothenate--cysteine ligase CoaBC [Saprospiraceae bacterium]
MQGKKILLAVTGSIAAYKAAYLTRLLLKAGAEVQVLMTEAATAFISPLTLSTLSKKRVFTQVSSEQEWNSHVELGLWADAMIVAPATANTLARLAHGICDNMVAAVYLSARCPVFFAPAMDLEMWRHPTTCTNVEKLKSFGNHFIPVGFGELASGLTGEGRMAEPEEILTCLDHFFQKEIDLTGKKALVTAGPTYEPIDPVRFIGNHSSGKMGVAIAGELARRGAQVTLVLGPSRLSAVHPLVTTVRVTTAEQMHKAATACFSSMDIAVLAAAVADYRPTITASEKIKKSETALSITLEKTPDIAATLGKMKKAGQFIAGFALETNDELKNARDKLEKKNFDFIVLNSLRDKGAGFHLDTNKITILFRDNKRKDFELKSKLAVAVDIVDEIAAALKKL